MIKVKIMLGLVQVKIMLVNYIYKIVFINKIVIVDVTVAKHNTFTHSKKAESKP